MTVSVRVLCIAIFLVILSGCANRPVFTVEVYKTPTAVPAAVEPSPREPVVPLVPTSTPILESTLLPTPAAAVMSPDFSPILYGRRYDANTFFSLLGGVQGSTWLTQDQAAAQFTGGWEYDVYTFAKRSFPVRGHSPQFSPISGGYYTVGTDVAFDDFGMVAVVKDWPVLQREAVELSSDSAFYQQAVLDWLAANDISTSQLDGLHVFRVDIEGDGTDEIFLSANQIESEHMAQPGDFSVILMRKVLGNDVVIVPIKADAFPASGVESSFPSSYSIANFIDLNRDGVLEIVVDAQRWEADGAFVYQIDGQDVIELFP